MRPVGWSHFEINDNDEKLTEWQTISNYWEKQPRRDHLQVVVQLPASRVVQAPVVQAPVVPAPVVPAPVTLFEIQLHHFCAQYWGKGDDGRKAIYQESEINIPPVDESDDEDSDLASGSNGPAADVPISYKHIVLGSDYNEFFGKVMKSLLIREEYYAVKDFLEDIFSEKMQGVVVLGQPGIGKNSHYRR